jgi:two-component system NtrC family sensor kinase
MLTAAVVPLVMFGALAWHGHVRTMNHARQALLQTSRIVHEHAEKVFQTNEVLLERAIDLVANVGPEAVHGREKEFHSKLRDLTAHIAQARAITVWDADGHPVSSSRYFPVPHEVSIADRPFFIGHKAHNISASINEPFDGQLGKVRIFNVSRRLAGAAGEFTGVVSLSLSQDYFTRFYRDVSGHESDLAISLFSSDGEVIARYPGTDDVPHAYGRDDTLINVIRRGSTEGIVDGLSTLDDSYRLAAFRHVAPYPIYVAVSRTSRSVFAEWRYDVLTLAAFVIPTWLALVLVVSLALKRARSEYDAIVNWHKETTRRAAAEDQLRQFQKYEALGELTGGLAHDFNNVLNIVSNNAAVMSLLPRDGDMRPCLWAITRAVASGSSLTKHLLAFARKQPLTFVRIRTSEAVPSICELAKHSLPKSIQLKYEVEPDIRDIMADSTELELALINLIINSRDAMPDGGEITVRARNVPAGTADAPEVPLVTRDYVAISVSDTGAGFPEGVLHRVFEPFFTTKKDKGTGLGLSRVYGYAMRLGGNVTAKNGASGGAEVTLYIPSAGKAGEDEQELEIRVPSSFVMVAAS